MSAKYFIIKPAVDTEETGRAFPAVKLSDDYDFNSANSAHKINSDSFPSFAPDLRFKLARGAKLCDVIGQAAISASGLLISDRLRHALEKINVIPHQFYSASLEDMGVLHNYYWLHLAWKDGINYLDFKNSKFQINEFGTNLGEIVITDYQNLLDKQTQLGFMKMIYNYSSRMHPSKYDLFLHPLNKTIYITENLKSILSSEGFSGIDLSLAHDLSVR